MTRLYKALPPSSVLWELFDYKPLTGELVWKQHYGGRSKAGSIAGGYNGRKACEVAIYSNKYLAHRLVWSWVTGTDPIASFLDHKNRNPKDNRFWNLRLATQSQNMSNVVHANPTGYKGVQRKGKRFTARIRIDGKVTYIGSYRTAAEAGAAYAAVAKGLHGDFACLEPKP